jgi:hypothetical protein
MKMATLSNISRAIGSQDYRLASSLIDQALDGEHGAHWHRDLGKLKTFLLDSTRKPLFTIIRKESGEGKLGKGFLSFSVLPDVTCPGAGDCLQYCYSFKAHRYPAAYSRQAQNTVLMQTEAGRGQIIAAIDHLASKRTGNIDFRLYVDGDFSSGGDVAFWMELLKQNAWLQTYGYSKSFIELLGYDTAHNWPANYLLNLSEGHKHNQSIVDLVASLPICRGSFGAVPTLGKYKPAEWQTSAYRKDILAQHKANTGRKAFVCGGRCGACITRQGINMHACGDRQFNNVDIIIAVH